MNSILSGVRQYGMVVLMPVLALQLAVLTAGCESEDYMDHDPPAGEGSLVVDNNTGDDIEVFVDGSYVFKVNSSSDSVLDTEPGVHRVVLVEEDGGDSSYSADVDVLEGRLTILEVWSSGDPYGYDVNVTFE